MHHNRHYSYAYIYTWSLSTNFILPPFIKIKEEPLGPGDLWYPGAWFSLQSRASECGFVRRYQRTCARMGIVSWIQNAPNSTVSVVRTKHICRQTHRQSYVEYGRLESSRMIKSRVTTGNCSARNRCKEKVDSNTWIGLTWEILRHFGSTAVAVEYENMVAWSSNYRRLCDAWALENICKTLQSFSMVPIIFVVLCFVDCFATWSPGAK